MWSHGWPMPETSSQASFEPFVPDIGAQGALIIVNIHIAAFVQICDVGARTE
jgi:hypothetical protein